MFFLPPSDIFTWKSINHGYLLAVYTPNTQNAPDFFVYNCQKRNISLSWWPVVYKLSILPFFRTSELVNRLETKFRFIWLLLNTSFLLFFPVWLVIALAAPILLHFQVEKHYLYSGFRFLTTLGLFYCLFSGVLMLNTYTVPGLVHDRVQKHNCFLCRSILTSKNVSGTWFVVFFSLNMFSLAFCGISSWKSFNHSYLLAVYSLNTPRTFYLFLYTS